MKLTRATGEVLGWGLCSPHEEEATNKHAAEDEDDELDWTKRERG